MYTSLMPDMIGIKSDAFETIEVAARFGFEGVDLRLDRFAHLFENDEAIGRFRNRLAEKRLRPGYCSILPGKISCDEAEWSDGIKVLPKLARLARKLGYSRTAAVILPGHVSLEFAANWDLHVRRIRQSMDVLNEFGIVLALEYVAPKTRRTPFKHPFIHSMRGLIELLDASDRCGSGVLLDSFHWHCARETRAQIENLPVHRCIVVHVNDAIPDRSIDEQVVGERLLPGESGVIDLITFFDALRKVGYDGPVTAEPTNPIWATIAPDIAAGRTAQSLRRFTPSSRHEHQTSQ